ncbi:MAG: cellulase family glycosylhydrolase, partial [Flavobacteriaceae bacterium]|nr:cellulase family glycosylhydrolase [Flavobacteriaceae bacterium]
MRKKILLISILFISVITWGQGLKTEGKKIVDQNGKEVILRGMGLGGWMLMEGYMMQSSDVADTQHEFRNRLIDLIGEAKTDEFYDAWLANHVTKKDIDSLAKWGFNSVRLPMHYNLFTLPIEDEPIKGSNTWLTKGFDMVDDLLDWCESNQMYLILDLHGAPGGQGANAAISDYDPSKPSLWESVDNQNKTIALWRKLAERYKDEPWIGGYDLLNEVNWTLPGNTLLRSLYIDITNSIREVDTKHIIFIEGNSFANDFTGLTPTWDDNMAYSFHKYWSHNNQGSIQWVLDLREKTNVPLWMGEAGENSNVWFTDAIKLFEDNNIGWSWWPMKRIETIVSPFSIIFSDGYKNILKYWRGEIAKPTEDEAYKAIMELANNTNSANCIYQKDVPDAQIRQVQTDQTIPYAHHTIPGVVHMSDFDLGKINKAYYDVDHANYSLSTGSFEAWNSGWVYRNDAVDVQAYTDAVNSNGYYIGFVKKDEWLNYTVDIDESAVYKAEVRVAAQSNGGQFQLALDGEEITTTQTVSATGGWEKFATYQIDELILEQGRHELKLSFVSDGEFNISSIKFTKTGATTESAFKALNGHTGDNNTIELTLNLPVSTESVNGSKDHFSLKINGTEEAITNLSTDANKSKTIIISCDKTLLYTDDIKVSYNGTTVSSSSGKTLEAFSDLKIRNVVEPLFILPGKIEAEAFMAMDGLGLEATTDTGGGSNIGYTDAGDFADYTIHVLNSGS